MHKQYLLMVGTYRRAVRRRALPVIRSSRELFPKPQSAQTEKQIRHHNKYQEVGPVFEKIGAAQNDRAHERDEISRRKERPERIKNPRHGFTRENESGKENARQQEHHRHLQRL